jgi:hypothetical protein
MNEWYWTDYVLLVMQYVMPIVFVVLAGILAALGKLALSYLQQWAGVKIAESQLYMIENIAQDAYLWAEEKARSAVKLTKDNKPSSAKKLEWALKYAVIQMEEQKLPKMAQEALVLLIEAKLSQDFTRAKEMP